MSGRIAYMERTERGSALKRMRLVAGRGEASWVAPEPGDAEAVARAAEQAADWIVEELAKGGRAGRRSLSAVCLDPDGAVCSWLTAPTSDPGALAATLRQGGEGDEASFDGGAPEHGLLAASAFGPDAQMLGGATVQALAPPSSRARPASKQRAAQPIGERYAVIAAPDTPARLFLDRLDRLGVERVPVMTLWHAMATAWTDADTERAHEREHDNDPTTPATPTTAVVLIEPEGRLIWCWSSGGALLAGGRLRLATHADTDTPRLRPDDLARLTADWLGWSAQLGEAPARIALVLPPLAGDASEEDGGDATLGLGGEGAARALGRAWPAARVELAGVPDPVGGTLRRVLSTDAPPDLTENPTRALAPLSARPGRSHRGMYRWLAGAIAGAGVVLAVSGWRLRESAAEARAQANALREEQRALLVAHDPALERNRRPVDTLREQVGRLREARAIPANIQPVWPVMPEVDTLAFVLEGVEGAELIKLSITQLFNRLEVRVPSTEAYESLRESLRSITGSRIATWDSTTRPEGRGENRTLLCVFTGAWPAGASGPATAQAPRAEGGGR